MLFIWVAIHRLFYEDTGLQGFSNAANIIEKRFSQVELWRPKIFQNIECIKTWNVITCIRNSWAAFITRNMPSNFWNAHVCNKYVKRDQIVCASHANVILTPRRVPQLSKRRKLLLKTLIALYMSIRFVFETHGSCTKSRSRVHNRWIPYQTNTTHMKHANRVVNARLAYKTQTWHNTRLLDRASNKQITHETCESRGKCPSRI